MLSYFPSQDFDKRMTVTIRNAVLDDVPSLLAIERESDSAAHWSREEYERRAAAGLILIAAGDNAGNKIVGFACANVIAGEWEIENVVVAEPAGRRGIGDSLLHKLVSNAREAGATALWLEVRESNHPAQELYKKHGFREVGRRPKYYREPPEDAVLYKLHLK